MKKCFKCGFKHYDFEKCLTTFLFLYEDYYGDEWQKIGAYSFEDAAERIAMHINEDEDEDENDTGTIIEKVTITNHDSSVIKYFSVDARAELHYYSKELLEGENK